MALHSIKAQFPIGQADLPACINQVEDMIICDECLAQKPSFVTILEDRILPPEEEQATNCQICFGEIE